MENNFEAQQILVSMMICPDGHILRSRHRHDFQEYKDIDGNYFFLDGGQAYTRHSGNGKLLTITTDDSHSIIREHFDWGSRGQAGDKPLHYIVLKDMEDSHINAILETQLHISIDVRKVFENEQQFRTLSDNIA